LTHLPPRLVEVGWRWLGAAVLLLGLWRLAAELKLTRTRTGLLLVLAAVLSAAAVNNGQVNVLVGGGAVCGTVATLRGRRWAAAGWFAVGGWVKVYPLAVGLLTAVARRRLAVPLVSVSVAGFALPLAVAPGYAEGQYRRLLEVSAQDDRMDGPADRVPRDWTVLARRLGWVPWVIDVKLISLAAAAALAGLTVLRPHPMLALCLGGGWMTAFGPATEGNTYAVLAGPAAWAAVAAGPGWAVWLGRIGCGLLAAAVLRGAVPGVGDFELLGVQPVGAVLVMTSAWGLCRR
jgi:hypothetical protein